jgi:hypothetical protein
MKKRALAIFTVLFAATFIFSACKDTPPADPCEGKGVLSIENKLDSALSVKIMETHNTVTIAKDYTLPFSLTGNQPYTLAIDGPQYHKDTTIMILFCDNKLFIVKK